MGYCNETSSNCFVPVDPPTLPHWSIHPLHGQCNNTVEYKGYIGGYNVDPITLLVSTMVESWPLVLICM